MNIVNEHQIVSEPEEEEGDSYEEMLSLAWKCLSEDEAIRLFGEDVIPVDIYTEVHPVQEKREEEEIPF